MDLEAGSSLVVIPAQVLRPRGSRRAGIHDVFKSIPGFPLPASKSLRGFAGTTALP